MSTYDIVKHLSTNDLWDNEKEVSFRGFTATSNEYTATGTKKCEKMNMDGTVKVVCIQTTLLLYLTPLQSYIFHVAFKS